VGDYFVPFFAAAACAVDEKDCFCPLFVVRLEEEAWLHWALFFVGGHLVVCCSVAMEGQTSSKCVFSARIVGIFRLRDDMWWLRLTITPTSRISSLGQTNRTLLNTSGAEKRRSLSGTLKA
jgi:hypothetical protein